jgi:hypothetical protein
MKLLQFSKLNNFSCLQLISNFVSLPWKLHNQYCHNPHSFQFPKPPKTQQVNSERNSVTHRHSHKFGSQFGGYFRQFSWHHWPMPVIFLWAATGIQTWLRITSWALPNGLMLSRVNTALGAGLFNCTFGGCPKWLIILISAQFLKVSWSPHPIAPVPLPHRAQVLPKGDKF